MPIKYKVVEKCLPGLAHQGEKKHYALPVMHSVLNLQDIIKIIEQRCTVNGADIHAALYALVDVAVEGLEDGSIVRLGELGSLRISLHSKGKDIASEVNTSDITGASVIFTPGTRIKTMIKSAKFQKQ
ncbi:MAG TPA: HU family DNA-binding protein [Prolixibacteraceae bacterium]|nr:HU family DNA-binding protein [Prolixibacteraceae bacterium]